jgi:hypothetical protein
MWQATEVTRQASLFAVDQSRIHPSAVNPFAVNQSAMNQSAVRPAVFTTLLQRAISSFTNF